METRIIKYRLNIHPTDFEDIESAIKRKLDTIFLNKCIEHIYVKDILRITNIGEITSYMYSNNAMHTLDIEVEVLGICYREGDIIPFAIMTNKENNISTFTDEAAIIISDNKNNAKIKTGDIFPLVVKTAEYIKFNPKININADRYSKANKTIAYYSVEPEDKYDEMINLNIAKIKDVLEKILELDEAIVTDFEKILFVESNLKYENSYTVLDLAKNYRDHTKKLIITYPTLTGKNSKVLIYNEDDDSKFTSEIQKGKINVKQYKINVEQNVPIDLIVLRLTRAYLINLEMLKAMAEKFSTKELISSNNNAWQLF